MFGLRCLHLHMIRMATMKTPSRRRKATEAGTAIKMRLAPLEAVFSGLAEVIDVICGEPGTWDEFFPEGGVLVFAGDGGDVVAGGGGVMMVSCGHAELLVWNLTSARCNQSSVLAKLNCKISSVFVGSPCMQYLTRCSQDLVSVLIS